MRAIGLKNINVLQPTEQMLKYLAQSVMTSFTELQWFRQQDDSPMSWFAHNQDLSPTKERFLWNKVDIIYERRFTIWKACKCEVTGRKYISNQKKVSSLMALKFAYTCDIFIYLNVENMSINEFQLTFSPLFGREIPELLVNITSEFCCNII